MSDTFATAERPPPAGVFVRPATPEDAEAVCALLNAVDVVELGRPETGLDEIVHDLTHPGADLEHDTWLAFRGARPVAYATVQTAGDGLVEADHYVLPDHQDSGAHLLDRLTRRARELAADAGAREAVLHLTLVARPSLDTRLLRPRGWRPVRRHQVMTRQVGPAADPYPVAAAAHARADRLAPAALRLRTCRTEADRRIAYDLHQRTFADHFGHRPRRYEQWCDDLGGSRTDWSLAWLAEAEGHGDCGVLLATDSRETMGWVRVVGVLPAARGRGIATRLLRTAFTEFAGRGRDTVGLGVDTENTTPALSLYQGLGMTVHFAADTWELRTPVWD